MNKIKKTEQQEFNLTLELICVYAPTNNHNEESRKFYTKLK